MTVYICDVSTKFTTIQYVMSVIYKLNVYSYFALSCYAK